MHSSCDWIYENQKPEQNRNLQKSDFSHPLLTYHHKQMQGMGGSNNVSSTTYSYHTQEAFPSQSNSMYTSSQPLQNHLLRYPHNSQINSTLMQNYNYKGSGNNQSIRKPPNPRIRVRDVYSLNNNTTHPSLLRNSMVQSQKQQCYLYNSTNVSPSYCTQTQNQCFNPNGVPVPDYNYTYQHYSASPTCLSYATNSQQHVHHPPIFQNSCNGQVQYNTLHQFNDQPSSQLSARLGLSDPTQVNTMPQKEFSHQSVIQNARINPSVGWNGNSSGVPAQAEQRQYSKENGPDISAIPTSGEPNNVPDSGGRSLELPYVPLLSPISPCSEPHTTPSRVTRANQEASRIASSQTSQHAICEESNQNISCSSSVQFTSMGTRDCITLHESNTQPQDSQPDSSDLPQEQNNLTKIDDHVAIDSLTSKEVKDVSLPARNPADCANTEGGEEDAVKKSVSECLVRLKQEKVEKSVEKEEGTGGESEVKRTVKREVEDTETKVLTHAEEEPKSDLKGEDEIEEEVVRKEEEWEQNVEEKEEKKETVEEEVVEIKGGEKYRSEIDRRKLNMLIQFLGKDEREKDNSGCREVVGEEKKNRRRKLSKKCVIKNKNCEKEFIAVNNVRKGVKEELSECKENEVGQKSSGEEEAESVVCERKNDSGEKSEECSLRENGEMLEERKIVNIMKAFQSLRHHFCANCNFVAPIEAIWINVVSGELRCVHCFRKMVLKTEKSSDKTSKFYANKETQSDPVQSTENKENTLEHKPEGEAKDTRKKKVREGTGKSSGDEKDRESSGSDELELEKREILGHVLRKQIKKEKRVEDRGKKRRASGEELIEVKVQRVEESGEGVKEKKSGSQEGCVGKIVTGEKAERKEERTKRRKEEEETKRSGSETEVSGKHKRKSLEKEREESGKQKRKSLEKEREESGKKRVKYSSEAREVTGEERRSDKEKGCSDINNKEERLYELLGKLKKRNKNAKGSELKEEKETKSGESEGKKEWKRLKEREESPKGVKKSSSKWKHERPRTEKSEGKERNFSSKRCNMESKEKFHSQKKLSDGHHHHKEKQSKTSEKHREHRRTQEQRGERTEKGEKKGKKEKAVECRSGEKVEGRKMPPKTVSNRLLEKLARKTKMLSWSLLNAT